MSALGWLQTTTYPWIHVLSGVYQGSTRLEEDDAEDAEVDVDAGAEADYDGEQTSNTDIQLDAESVEGRDAELELGCDGDVDLGNNPHERQAGLDVSDNVGVDLSDDMNVQASKSDIDVNLGVYDGLNIGRDGDELILEVDEQAFERDVVDNGERDSSINLDNDGVDFGLAVVQDGRNGARVAASDKTRAGSGDSRDGSETEGEGSEG